jgi:hypothetical protein
MKVGFGAARATFLHFNHDRMHSARSIMLPRAEGANQVYRHVQRFMQLQALETADQGGTN